MPWRACSRGWRASTSTRPSSVPPTTSSEALDNLALAPDWSVAPHAARSAGRAASGGVSALIALVTIPLSCWPPALVLHLLGQGRQRDHARRPGGRARRRGRRGGRDRRARRCAGCGQRRRAGARRPTAMIIQEASTGSAARSCTPRSSVCWSSCRSWSSGTSRGVLRAAGARVRTGRPGRHGGRADGHTCAHVAVRRQPVAADRRCGPLGAAARPATGALAALAARPLRVVARRRAALVVWP